MNKGIRYVRTVMLLGLMLVLGAAFSGGKAEAASKYMIKINKQQNVVTVYKMKGGKYKAYKAFVCSAGYATPTGTFRLGEKMRWHTLDGPSYGQYCSRIVNGILFHSVWYYQPNQATQSYVQYNRLGTTASHGCVRLTTAGSDLPFQKTRPSWQTKSHQSPRLHRLGSNGSKFIQPI